MLSLPTLWQRLVDGTVDRCTQPLLAILGVPPATLSAHELAESLLVAAIQVALIALVFRPLESIAPAERWADRRLTRVDRQYTLLMLVGLLPLPVFLALTPLRALVAPESPQGGLLHSIPWLDAHPYALFCVYYLVFDFVYYWMHRAEHALPWWWALHSLHHSQRQVSCWTNHRDCILSGLMEAGILASVGIVLGVDPAQFALLMLAGELVQDFSHANLRMDFGSRFGRVLVGPAFHRLHHMRSDPAHPGLHNCNFAQAFPLWDLLFGTALYGVAPRPTGVGDPVVDADNARGLVGQQVAALRRFLGAVRSRAGWRPGDVSFGSGYVPVPDAQPLSSRRHAPASHPARPAP